MSCDLGRILRRERRPVPRLCEIAAQCAKLHAKRDSDLAPQGGGFVGADNAQRVQPAVCKVYCLSGERKKKLLELQGGNRGFGHLADKVLVVTSSLEGIATPGERNDIFVNGGMFLMNLCYSLHYHKIAHCILTWAQPLAKDAAAREIIGPTLKKEETIIALLSCGEAPGEFDVADSPRKSLDEVFENV